MSERYADMLRRAFDIRHRSDYEVYFVVDRQQQRKPYWTLKNS